MTVIQLAEYEWRDVDLDREAVLALAGTGAVDASPTSTGWRLRASGVVGVVTVAGLELRVTPKVSVPRLLYLLGHAKDGDGWLDELVGAQHVDDLVGAVAVALGRQVERALAQGVLQGYVVVEESDMVVRGRIREREQAVRRFGQVIPLELRYDDYTVDVMENRILVSAARRLLRLPHVPDVARRSLRRQLLRLADVTPLVAGAPLPAAPISRLNARYAGALALSRLVLRGTGLETRSGPGTGSGFLFDMPKVFEAWVTARLEAALDGAQRRVRPQYPMHLDEARRIPMRPDVVVLSASKQPLAVLDVKYKDLRDRRFPNADVYQLLAYCTALELKVGHLVYAAGETEPSTHVLRHAGVEIVVHVLDLTAERGVLEQQIDQLAASLVEQAAT